MKPHKPKPDKADASLPARYERFMRRMRHRWRKLTKAPMWLCKEDFRMRVARLQPGDVAIDCGANVGRYTTPMAATGATVHAFEPDPHAFARLREAVAGHPNVVLHNAAVGDRAGAVTLYRATDFDSAPDMRSQSTSAFGDKVNVDQGAAFEVEQIDLAAFIQGLGQDVRILKIDVEGAEVPVLEHLLATGAIARVDKAFVETHEHRIPSLAARTEALRRRIAETCPGRVDLNWQ